MHERVKIVHSVGAFIVIVLYLFKNLFQKLLYVLLQYRVIRRWIFLSFVDVLLLFLEESEVIFRFSGIIQTYWWQV